MIGSQFTESNYSHTIYFVVIILCRVFITGVLIVSLSLEGAGQANKSIFYNKDGSIFIGEVLEQDKPDIQLRLVTGDTIALAHSKVKKTFSDDDVTVYNNGKFHNLKGLFIFATVSFLPELSTQVAGAAGYRLNKRWSIGVGSGYDTNSGYAAGIYFVEDFFSLYGYGRFFLNDWKWRLFAEAKLGHSWAASSGEASGGLLLQPGGGVILPSRNEFRWFFGLNLYIQQASGEESLGWIHEGAVLNYNMFYFRPMIRIGLEFH